MTRSQISCHLSYTRAMLQHFYGLCIGEPREYQWKKKSFYDYFIFFYIFLFTLQSIDKSSIAVVYQHFITCSNDKLTTGVWIEASCINSVHEKEYFDEILQRWERNLFILQHFSSIFCEDCGTQHKINILLKLTLLELHFSRFGREFVLSISQLFAFYTNCNCFPDCNWILPQFYWFSRWKQLFNRNLIFQTIFCLRTCC